MVLKIKLKQNKVTFCPHYKILHRRMLHRAVMSGASYKVIGFARVIVCALI